MTIRYLPNLLAHTLLTLTLLAVAACGDDDSSGSQRQIEGGENNNDGTNNPGGQQNPCDAYCELRSEIELACDTLPLEGDCVERCEASPSVDVEGLTECLGGEATSGCQNSSALDATMLSCFEAHGHPGGSSERVEACDRACLALDSWLQASCGEGNDNDECMVQCYDTTDSVSLIDSIRTCVEGLPTNDCSDSVLEGCLP